MRDGNQFIKSFPITQWYQTTVDMAVACPGCNGEARFHPATVHVVSQAKVRSMRTAGVIGVFKVADRVRSSGKARFSSFAHNTYGAFYHNMGQTTPEDWEKPNRLATDIGTLRCLSCNLCRRHVLDWPATAHYQLDFDGQLLWLYNREHLSALIALLEAKNPRGASWFYWFNNKLPAHFKSAKARKVLPARLRKLLL